MRNFISSKDTVDFAARGSRSSVTYQFLHHLCANEVSAQHSTAQHSTAQHSTAQHSTAQHSTVSPFADDSNTGGYNG